MCVSSERRLRHRANTLVGENLEAEEVPFIQISTQYSNSQDGITYAHLDGKMEGWIWDDGGTGV